MPEKRTELNVAEIEELRRSLKENGLERAVQLMGVTQRGLARRAIREGLALLAAQQTENDAYNRLVAAGKLPPHTAPTCRCEIGMCTHRVDCRQQRREAFDPNKADGYAQKDGKTVLVREQ